MIKRITLLFRKPGLSSEEFSQCWKEHGRLIAARTIPGARKYTQSHIIRLPNTKRPAEYDIDGITEFWFDDLAAFNRYMDWLKSSDAVAKELVADGNRCVDDTSLMYAAEEHCFL